MCGVIFLYGSIEIKYKAAPQTVESSIETVSQTVGPDLDVGRT